jgi:hypothetical protein
MQLNFNDWIGFTGVAILLIAFLLNLMGRLSKDGLLYILMNFTGASLASLASYLIRYIPFIILEGTWALVSLIAFINYFRRKVIY